MSTAAALGLELEHSYTSSPLAKPIHVQQVEKALHLEPLLSYVEGILSNPTSYSDVEDSTGTDTDVTKDSDTDFEGNKILNGIVTSRAERKADKARLYNFSKVKKSRKWLKNVLLSDSSSDDEDEDPIRREDLQETLKLHKYMRQTRVEFYQDPQHGQYQYYSTGLLSNYDKFAEHQKMIVGPRKKVPKDQKKHDKKMKAKLKRLKKEKIKLEDGGKGDGSGVSEHSGHIPQRTGKVKKLTPEQAAIKRKKIWANICKKEIPKAQKQKASLRKEIMTNLRKAAIQCMKECRRAANHSQKIVKEAPMRARRLTREMQLYWKRFEKVEKEHRRKAEKEAMEQRKLDLELQEMKRQQRKLNFLITQTELYAHFMSRKLTGASTADRDRILNRLQEGSSKRQLEVKDGVLEDIAMDDYDSEKMKNLALTNAQKAHKSHMTKMHSFKSKPPPSRSSALSGEQFESSLANPAISTTPDRPQPSLFEGKLKTYQLKGMNWLANLYDQGINGILADEMGLGKTVQSIALMAHLAESQNIWGPFLIIAPASTLHNWQQEIVRFVSKFKVVPYWGNTQDRKVLRKFWNQGNLHSKEASFHVVITSYQLIVQDVKYFQRIHWQYMILDEAQAIKSSSSARWKVLLGFNCRNRLLLTGTPIQNSMAELWALLHFIMPTLFDSHDEFNEWFSKDIESHAEKQSGIDENQLSRLHMILKPFMLRRVKKDVENELGDKIEILVYCPLTTRQRLLYQAIKNKISIEDLIQSASAQSQSQALGSTSSLMNLVMQFRKVCNHPELFERREIRSPCFIKIEPYLMPKLLFRDGLLEKAVPSKDHILYNKLYIFNPQHIHQTLQHTSEKEGSRVNSCFSFLRFIDHSPAEMAAQMLAGLLVRWLAVYLRLKEAYRIHHQNEWSKNNTDKSVGRKGFLLEPVSSVSFSRVRSSPHLQQLVFTSATSTTYTHTDHILHYTPETVWHRKLRSRRLSAKLGSPVRSPTKLTSPPLSPSKVPTSPSKKHHAGQDSQKSQDILCPPHRHIPKPPQTLLCQPTVFPAFLYKTIPKVHANSHEEYCVDRSAAWCKMKELLCGTRKARNSLLYGSQETYEHAVWWRRWQFFPTQPDGIKAVQPRYGYSNVLVPDKETLVTDAGKLYVLDTLLVRLKREGHRVLIYSQMTRMIDLLEEYMWHRKHTYMRLDGSSKISDRRDMVADFQTRSDIFVFLLSTRAGGLGINLTAADTVIFYDSDWNPTVDQQAMDRAHRLGQTKQVTVYRLVCKGTIEERILQRAREKSEIQKMVITGGSFRPDVLRPKEVVSLLLDDDELTKKLHQKNDDKKSKVEAYKEKDRKRKREKYATEKRPGPGPGRPKKKRAEEVNVTIPAPAPSSLDGDSILSIDSTSAAASPLSVMSVGSLPGNDDSNDALVIVDDAHTTFPPVSTAVTTTPSGKRGRGRGRPKGSGVGRGRRPRGRGSVQKALSAAEIAGAKAGKSAAYKAFGYNFKGLGSAEEGTTAPKSGSSGGGTTPSKSRGGGSGGGGALSQALSTPPGGVQAAATAAAPATPASKGPGFYTQASPGHS